MAIWERQLKRTSDILADLQAIDPRITDVRSSGGGFLMIKTDSVLDAPTAAAIADYSPFTMVQVGDATTRMFNP